MTRLGRKPLATGHVDHLAASPHAKRRLTAVLKTLSGEWTIPQACTELGIHEAYFHALRHEWLQGAVELLEPKPIGRPPQAAVPATNDKRIALLERELQMAETRREVAEVLASAAPLAKKGARKKS